MTRDLAIWLVGAFIVGMAFGRWFRGRKQYWRGYAAGGAAEAAAHATGGNADASNRLVVIQSTGDDDHLRALAQHLRAVGDDDHDGSGRPLRPGAHALPSGGPDEFGAGRDAARGAGDAVTAELVTGDG